MPLDTGQASRPCGQVSAPRPGVVVKKIQYGVFSLDKGTYIEDNKILSEQSVFAEKSAPKPRTAFAICISHYNTRMMAFFI